MVGWDWGGTGCWKVIFISKPTAVEVEVVLRSGWGFDNILEIGSVSESFGRTWWCFEGV